MIIIKNENEIVKMRNAGRVAAAALEAAKKCVEQGTPGILTTADVDRAVAREIRKWGAAATFLNYNGFPGKRLCLRQRGGHPRHPRTSHPQ